MLGQEPEIELVLVYRQGAHDFLTGLRAIGFPEVERMCLPRRHQTARMIIATVRRTGTTPRQWGERAPES